MKLRQFTRRLPRYFMGIGAPLATLFVTLLLASAVNSQVLYGTLVGRVEDQAGAVVAGANVSSPTRRADRSIINTNGYSEITSAQGTERQFRFALKLTF